MSAVFRHIITCALLSVALHVTAADTYSGPMAPTFASLQVKVNGSDQLPAVIALESSDWIEISFDELADNRRYLRGRLVHCSMDWRPDGLFDQMFLDGFNEIEIDNIGFSQATTVNYVHYSLTIPNERFRIKASGNYLVEIFDESNPQNVLVQARFSVCENLVDLNAKSTTRTDIDYQKAHQQLSLEVNPKLLDLNDPYRDVRVVVNQNNRLDNMVTLEAPMRIVGKKLIYEHLPGLIFEAGNEYRRFETITVNYPLMHVEQMCFLDPFYHATLIADEPRSYSSYQYDQTQQGRFRIRDFDSDDPDTEADYVLTHFTLYMPQLYGQKVYLDGDMTNRRLSPSAMMIYDHDHQCYTATLLLKQGSYNYQYLTLADGQSRATTATVEGNFYQTVNEYGIYVYYRQPGDLYDRLIGHYYFLSNV